MATAIEDLNGDNFLDAFEAKVGYVPNRVLFGGRAGAITTDDDRNDEQPANVEAEVPGTDGSNDESSNRDANTGNIPEAARIPFDAAAAQSHQQAWASSLNTPVEHVNSVGVKLVLIPPGEFRMGFTDEQIESTMQFYDERSDGNGRDDLLTRIRPRLAPSQPQHTVVITNPFYFAVHPVTVGQFREFVDETAYETTAEADGKGGAFKSERNLQWNWNSPGFSQNDNHPVVQISRSDALAFCDWLGRRENRTYVLPTEAQWEFACRAGTETRWHYGEDRNEHWESYSLHSSGEQPETLPVGGKLPNAFGIFDLYGHPLELVADWWAPYSASRQIDPEFTTFSDRMVVRGNPYYGSAWRGYVDVSRLPGFDSTFRIATVLNQPE